MIIGTAGHIDHGKTTLVKALTGVDTDRLKEEKSRGISIDLGFAYKRYPDLTSLAFVDVPGHQRFIRNMVAGACGIDFALLVVASNEGPKPQTHEHALVLKLLGIHRGVVVLTKTDLADDDRLEALKGKVAQVLSSHGLSSFPMFAVSAHRGLGLQRLEEHLRAEARQADVLKRVGRFRLPIDRSFDLAGFGPIVTGTVWSGEVRVGDSLTVWPSGHGVRIRRIHADGVEAACGRAGERCALNLVGPGFSSEHARRGHWAVDPDLDLPTSELDARVVLGAAATRALVHWSHVQLYLATGVAEARIALLDKRAVQPAGEALARLVMGAPVLCLHGDRFLIRDLSSRRVIGGGAVLDPFPPARRRRKPERVSVLQTMEDPSPTNRLMRLLAASPSGIDLRWFRTVHNLDAAQADMLLQDLPLVQIVARGCDWGFERGRFDQLYRTARDEVGAFVSGAGATEAGMRAEELRRRLGLNYPAWGALLSRLIADGRLVRAGGFIATPDHVAALTPHDQALLAHLRTPKPGTRYEPLSISRIASELHVDKPAVRDGVKRLARLGHIAFIAREHVLPSPAVLDLARLVERSVKESREGVLTITELRALTGCGRNAAVALLEYFDRCRFTRRDEKGRRLVRSAAASFPQCQPGDSFMRPR
jgi:selenocysteine-specific elongation factor